MKIKTNTNIFVTITIFLAFCKRGSFYLSEAERYLVRRITMVTFSRKRDRFHALDLQQSLSTRQRIVWSDVGRRNDRGLWHYLRAPQLCHERNAQGTFYLMVN